MQSRHTLFSAAFTTNIAESNFRYTQAPLRLTPTRQIAAPHAATTAQPPAAKNTRDARNKRAPEANIRRAPVRASDDDYDEVDYAPRSRVVERSTEREYLLPSRGSSERRGVIIIRRGDDQNPFGSVFGSIFR